jgi:zinc/manganese transport system substrate-binding protein
VSGTRGAAVLAGALVVLAAAACGSASSAASPASSSGGSPAAVDVVASTNVWGDVVSAVGGKKVRVTSVISDPSADPHSYEANPHVQLEISRADVVVTNGGGYDDFMGKLISASGTKARVVDAVEVSGKTADAQAANGRLNEHIWYDIASVGKVSDAVVSALSAADPSDAVTFRANAQTFRQGLDALTAQETAARARTQGAGVVVTEPVPLYMLQALGAVNRTPSSFAQAVEDGTDVPPSVLKQTEDLLAGGSVRALVYNAQTSGAQTELVKAAAQSHSVPVVPVTETLPKGKDYLTWMKANLDALTTALTS